MSAKCDLNRLTGKRDLSWFITKEEVGNMAIMIGHASISETGGINGTKGDSTGKEVCIRTWYSKPWDFVAIHPDAAVREKHAAAVEAACANDNIGYGQSDRNTLNTQAKAVDYDLKKITTKCNCDCSSMQNVAAVASGAPGVTYGSNGWTTRTMKAALKAAGYKIIEDTAYLTSSAYCVRGAIYVKEGSHTVCGLTNGSKASQTLEKAGITSDDTGISTANNEIPAYEVGHVYTLQVELKVRTGVGTNYSAKSNRQLTADGKKHDSDKDGALDKGTQVTCKAVKNVGSDIWIQCPSGWLAAYYDGHVYIK